MTEKRNGLKPVKTSSELLDMYYLEARSHLLETAAILDRIERAEGRGKTLEDQRIQDLFDVCHVLSNTRENRAEQILNLLSV